MSARNGGGLRKLVGPPRVTILRDDLLDPRLSLAARGLLATMHADPNGDLPQIPGVEAAYAELEAAGYVGPDDEQPDDEQPDNNLDNEAPVLPAGSVVYYLQRADNAIKIGFTAHRTPRFKKLAAEHGALTLLATEPGGWHLEQDRHQLFADLRITPKAEWFRPGEALMAHIRQMRSGRAAA